MALACHEGKSEILSLLLKAGARTDIQEKVTIAQSAVDWLAIQITVFILVERKQKNNFKSGLRTITVKTTPGSEFSYVN